MRDSEQLAFFRKQAVFSDDAGSHRSPLRRRATSCLKTQQNAGKVPATFARRRKGELWPALEMAIKSVTDIPWTSLREGRSHWCSPWWRSWKPPEGCTLALSEPAGQTCSPAGEVFCSPQTAPEDPWAVVCNAQISGDLRWNRFLTQNHQFPH